MRVISFDTVADFAERVTPLLVRDEAENCLILGNISELTAPRPGHAEAEADASAVSTWAVEGPDAAPVAAAMLKPSRVGGGAERHPAVISRSPPEATAALVAHFQGRGVHLPGATAPEPTITQFAAAWGDAAGVRQEVAMALRLMKLTHVRPHRPTSGAFRAAAPADSDRLVEWAGAFFEEIGHPEPSGRCADTVRRRIEEGRLFVWCDPEIVSMAGWAGPTPGGARVNFVYTPPENRGRGYASACVARLSRHLLAAGRRFCCLFTDAGNPTSNRIYESIGYRHVCDFRHVRFETATDADRGNHPRGGPPMSS